MARNRESELRGFRRKTPEEVLQSISDIHRGRLKIYLGAVSGSGKTYHMLREGQGLKENGIDVVLCAVSTLNRPETARQARGLEVIGSLDWSKDGVLQQDLNLAALIERNPEVVLVDGLAHRNRQDALFPTRLEDITFLLEKGISVITTVNVYELEGVRELARKLAGVHVKTTVPSNTLEMADEIRLIDVTPETILKRLEEGKISGKQEEHLFLKGNIGILRELALRLVAEDVNGSLEKYRKSRGLSGPFGAGERILVSTQYHWNGSIYVRRGQQIASRLNGDLYVVCFQSRKKPLNKEQAAFKRSLKKLVDKIGAVFEELPFPGRRKLADSLLDYAMKNSVTRIVLGHSKHTRIQELWQGSIINDLMKKITQTDLFVVADRAERDGERILPAKLKAGTKEDELYRLYRRSTKQDMQKEIEKIRRGIFKVYIGAAPGVGKTYTMLREGNDLACKGIDAVIGLLETHGRRETSEQVGSLEIIPRRKISYRGTTLEEMDTVAILDRNPEVVLVDELAHTNVPGSRHHKRFEDVLDLLNAGISVITTVNVQHLESLNDAVEQITGVRVRETVPDSILRMADEVELIDVPPQTLRQRMKEGRIYSMEKVEQALNHFFKTGNLIALRELALREIADDVDERLESWERKASLRGPWRREEAIFVCVKLNDHAERIIRRGFRIAFRLKARWHVAYLHLGNRMEDAVRQRLAELKGLTERLGGTFEVIIGQRKKDPADLLLAKANEYRSTQMILGKSASPSWRDRWQGSLAKRLLRGARHMDVLVVTEYEK